MTAMIEASVRLWWLAIASLAAALAAVLVVATVHHHEVAVYLVIALIEIALLVRYPILWVIGLIFALWAEGK